ncbi:hypothetical protein E6O75_ATG00272 [Venturia nashicola]|uniref:T6SS Phospholipase effector Tle1-like catalytic domain-containing protein n=1 Tax=Venturia nashicola TaxID=86259 RepID=A0A4Z1PDB5_9PEZI|nr:hypothetical protein E6O75_ATG00272 [Venturia nashicola]
MTTLQPHVPSGRRNSSVPDNGARASNVQEIQPDMIPIQNEFGNRSRKSRRTIVLCFDGTGNKFSGTDSDSNILKIYRMLDRDDSSQFHYYQPGIGTYIATSSFSQHTSSFDKFKSWYAKAKDSAVGTSFDEHVMGGYKFLMRYYHVGDDIFLFGFSRGAYTARFLAEMLDHVGLLSAGNEEMCRFAWKAFQKWQCRTEATDKERDQKRFLMNYMFAFRETFSRPVHRIRFLGLFDTVNSVPRFESALMKRSKFPYTARSTAKVIRHAVAIDERRAKFRQDLISELKPTREAHYRRRHKHLHLWDQAEVDKKTETEQFSCGRTSVESHTDPLEPAQPRLQVPKFRDPSEVSGVRSLSPNARRKDNDGDSFVTSASQDSLAAIRRENGIWAIDEDSDGEEQDIKEVWFPGCHADIGGGWPLHPDEDAALSHVPLVWMVREAERAGLRFDPNKVRALNCSPEDYPTKRRKTIVPQIAIEPTSPPEDAATTTNGIHLPASFPADDLPAEAPSNFQRLLTQAATRGRIHDVLQFNQGASPLSVLSWNIMEYLPFRRMDLQPNGTWRSITWPLPKGEEDGV